MKLLMTCDAVGGVWQYATDLADALAAQGVEVLLAVVGPSEPLPPTRASGVQVIPTHLPLDWLATGAAEVLAAGRAIAALAAEHRVDLIQLNSPTLAAAGPFPAPLVAVAHGCVGTWWAAAHGTAPDAEYSWHGELMRAGLLAADAVVAPTAAYAQTVRDHYHLPMAPIAIHNGRAPRALPDARPVDHVLTAGRLWDRVKNTALLDEVAALLPVPLRAAGPTTAPHGETVATRHLRPLGVLSDAALAAEYAARPIFVSAARFEPFGLAVLEAAQAGCALVLSDIATFRELWSGAALFVGNEMPGAWAEAIERIRLDADLRTQLGDAARARAARYTPEATATAMLALYRSLRAPDRVAA